MSITEQLHQKIDELNEAQQQELLATVNELLSEETYYHIPGYGAIENPKQETADQRQRREKETEKMLLERYEHAKTHPETLVDVRESTRKLRERYSMAGNKSYHVSFTLVAQQERDDVMDWYESRPPKFGEQWLIEFERLLDRLEDNALLYSEYLYFVHRAPLRRFPFAVFFVTDTVNYEVEIIAIRHTNRDPDSIHELINS